MEREFDIYDTTVYTEDELVQYSNVAIDFIKTNNPIDKIVVQSKKK